ncbi:MAG: lectin [Lysobacter sp.]
MKPALPMLTLGVLLAVAACADRGAEDAAASATPSPALDPPAQEAPSGTVPADTPGDTADAPAADPATGDGPASYNGFADAEFGMDAEQVRAVWDGELDGGPGDGAGAEGESCFHLNPVGQPDIAYFALMFGDGKFARYSVSNDDMVAPGGGRRGMEDTEIAQLYGDDVERQPHKYTDGEYLRIRDPAGSAAMLIFETDAEGTVTEWRVGLPPHVDYVEGCA